MAIRQQNPTFGLNRVGERQSGVRPVSVPPAVTGANIVELNVPSQVVAGGTLTITGRVHYNNISRPLTKTPVRVQARVEGQTPVTHQVDDLAHCNERGFSLEVQAVGQAGDTMSVEVVSQSSAAGGWGDNETQGPFTVQVLSEGAAAQQQLTEFAPWAVGGGAIGAGAATFTNRSPLMGGALGVGAGVGAKALTDQGGLGGVIGFPSIDPIQAVTLAALLGGGALFLGEVTDLGIPGASDVRRRLPSRGPRRSTSA